MKNYSILILFIILFSCNTACKKGINIIENCTFSSVLEASRKKDKPIFLMISGGSNCIPCTNF